MVSEINSGRGEVMSRWTTHFPSEKCRNQFKQLSPSRRLKRRRCNSRNNFKNSNCMRESDENPTPSVSGPQRTTTLNNTEQSDSTESFQTPGEKLTKFRRSSHSDKVKQTDDKLETNRKQWMNSRKSYLSPTIELPQFPLFLVKAAGSHVAVCELEFERV